jgi:hypothetical protein
MIVVSAAMVLLALVALIVGMAVRSLSLVYAAIGVSLASAALQAFIWIRRRDRAGALPAGAGVSERRLGLSVGHVTTLPPPRVEESVAAGVVPDEVASEVAPELASGIAAPEASVPEVAVPEVAAGLVTVVSGRPRYHRAGCRYVSAHPQAERVTREEATGLGFTPCGACRPDAPERTTPSAIPAEEVVVVAGRAKFHRATCRYARSTARVTTLTREEALEQGFGPCGVCKP